MPQAMLADPSHTTRESYLEQGRTVSAGSRGSGAPGPRITWMETATCKTLVLQRAELLILFSNWCRPSHAFFDNLVNSTETKRSKVPQKVAALRCLLSAPRVTYSATVGLMHGSNPSFESELLPRSLQP